MVFYSRSRISTRDLMYNAYTESQQQISVHLIDREILCFTLSGFVEPYAAMGATSFTRLRFIYLIPCTQSRFGRDLSYVNMAIYQVTFVTL